MMSQIPLSRKVDRENRKKLLSAIARGRIPDEIIDRRKRGFISALWSAERLDRPGMYMQKDPDVVEDETPARKRRPRRIPDVMPRIGEIRE